MKMMRRSPDERFRTAADCLSRFRGLGPGLDPVGDEFQPSFETAHPGGGAHLVRLCPLSPAVAGLSRLKNQ